MNTPIEFLKKEFQNRQKRNPNYSLRAFAKWLNVSPAQLSQMLTGKRSITLKTLKKVSDRLDLSPAQNQELMNSLLEQRSLITGSDDQNMSLLNEDQFQLMSDWYHLAILSLTIVKGAKSDPRWIAQRLGIKVEEANQAILRLKRLQLLQTEPTFKQMGEPFEVVSEIPSAAIRKYHKQNLSIASEKLETVDVSLRQFQSISIPTTPAVIKVVKIEMDRFLNRVSELCKTSQPTQVYNLNVQFFPVTQILNQESRSK